VLGERICIGPKALHGLVPLLCGLRIVEAKSKGGPKDYSPDDRSGPYRVGKNQGNGLGEGTESRVESLRRLQGLAYENQQLNLGQEGIQGNAAGKQPLAGLI